MQITTYTAPVVLSQITHTAPARSGAEIIDRVRTATASVSEIRLFMQRLGPNLDKNDLQVVGYALARARYRAGDTLSIEQLAMLGEVTLENAKCYLRKFNASADLERISQMDVNRVLFNIMD